jgi:hypothetical protein
MKAIDLKGQKFGKLSVREFAGHKNKSRQWLCVCDCGNEKIVRGAHLTKGYTKSCGCEAHPSKSNHKSWKGYEDIPLDFFTTVKRNAEIRNIEFDITIEYLWEVFEKQNHKCSLSGRDLKFGRVTKDRKGKNVSIDRIDSTIGYVSGNIQWIDKQINIMKNNLNEKEFLSLCNEIVKFKKL